MGWGSLSKDTGKGEYQIILWYSLVSGRCGSWIYCVRKWSEIEMPFNFEGRSSLGCSRNRRAPLEHVKAATVRFSARAPTRKEKSLRQRKRRLEALRAKCGRGFTAKANERAHRYQHGVDYHIPQKKNIRVEGRYRKNKNTLQLCLILRSRVLLGVCRYISRMYIR